MGEVVSIVIPMHNLEERISDTLKSVLLQDYPDLEMILVDDASMDETLSLAEAVMKKDGRIYKIIVQQENKGVSAARNAGLDAATGKYVLFMDGDDMADQDFISILHAKINEKQSDLAFCGFRTRYLASGEERFSRIPLEEDKEYAAEYLAAMRILSKVKPHLCSTLYRRNFLVDSELRFVEGCSGGQDVEFVIKALVRSRKSAFSTKCPYIYLHHDKMNSQNPASSKEKKITRYQHFTEAHFRLADYIEAHSSSQELLRLAKFFLRPQAYIRRLTIYAMRHEEQSFFEELSSKGVRKILWDSCKAINLNPEIFIKALWLLVFPGTYFKMRKGKYR